MKTIRKDFKNYLRLTAIIFIGMILFLTPVDASAVEIDSIIIKKENSKLIELNIDDYVGIYLTKKGSIYDLLINQHGYIDPMGIRSGNKYIEIDEYVNKYLMFGGNVSDAIQFSHPMETNLISSIKDISEYLLEINSVKIGTVEGTIDKNIITVNIPKNISQDQINYIELDFSKDVKIIEIDDDRLSLDVINRFKENGYNLNNYYNHYKIRVSWTYSRLVNLQTRMSYLVVTRDGYKERFDIELIIK